MAYRFLVYVASDGRASLCEGGVFTDDSAILAAASEYRANDFAAAIRELESLNGRSQAATPPYELRDSADDIDATDSDVLSSLEDWQLAAILEGTEELGRLSNASAIYRERGRRAIDKAPCGFILLDATGEIRGITERALGAQIIAAESDSVWHKSDGQRPYQLDAIRLQALADMETGRDIMGRSSDIPEDWKRLADAIGAAVSPGDSGDIPDSLAQELGRVFRAAPGDDSAYLKSELATFRGLLAAARGELSLELRPMPGERVDNDGAAIRSNRAWRELAAVAIRQSGEARAEARDATESLHAINSELSEAREALADWKRKADMAEADCELARRQRNAELAAHNELAAFIGELAPVLAALPLAVLASDATEGGKLANLYLRAELLADETTGERAARYRKESE